MIDIQFEVGSNSVTFDIKNEIYPLNVIMKTAYNFTNKFYIFLDYVSEGCIQVQIKPKALLSNSELEKVVGEFFNELLNQNIRYDIENRTSNLRQLILGRALYTECIETDENYSDNETQEGLKESTSVMNKNEDYIKDINEIATCWNEGAKYEGDR